MAAEQPETSLAPYNEKHSSKLWRKMREAPFVPLGIAGLVGAVTYGILQYRKRGNMSTSVYVMHFRVFSQGMVVGAITIGVGINICQKLWERYTEKASTSSGAGSI